MKRAELIRILKKSGCVMVRDKGPHSVWSNPATGGMATVPRHQEIKQFTAKAIFEGLDLETRGRSFT